MSNIKANNQPEEFKHSSVKLALDSDQSVAQTAKDLEIKSGTLHGWIYKYRHLFEGAKSKPASHEEVVRLQKENKRLRMERDILKKASAYFAKELL